MPHKQKANSRPVVLIEDDPDVVTFIAALANGHDLAAFGDGQSALDALTGDAPLPRLVLLDLDLPGMHGLEVLRLLRHHPRTRYVPVVIFTGTDRPPSDGYRLGANAWVHKSTDIVKMEESVRAIFAFWIEFNQAAGDVPR